MPARNPQPVDDPLAALAATIARMTPAKLAEFSASLTDKDRELVQYALGGTSGAAWRQNPLTMAVHLGHLEPMPHTELLARKFADAVEGRSTRQIWNMPPQHGKSAIASQWGPVWALAQDPAMPIILTSYGDQLAERNSIAVRNLLAEHEDELHVRLQRDQRRMNRWVTEQGGGIVAAGVGSALTGFGAQGIVIDDPLKNWKEAHSEAQRQAVWNWYRSVARSRLWDRPDKPGWIVVVMTRWHEDDLTGLLLEAGESGEGEEWELVRLPAIAEAPEPNAADSMLRVPDLLGRAPGEALAPLLFDIDALQARARSFGSYLSAGLEQQRPAPEEGSDIMRGWWKWYDAAPPRFDDALTSWDMKLKDKEAGDFVVGQAWGRTGSDFWCVDSLRGQWNQATTKNAIALLAVRNPHIGRHVIENTGNGPEVLAELRKPQPGYTVSEEIRSQLGMTEAEARQVSALLRKGMTGLLPENVRGDKRVRMRAQAPLLEAGNVHLPNGSGWAESLVNEAAAFPNGSHDDQVDACSQALKRLAGAASSVAPASSRRPGKPKPGQRARQVGRPSARGAPTLMPVPGQGRIRRIPGGAGG